MKKEQIPWRKYRKGNHHKRFMVTIPDETAFIALSHKLYAKYQITPKEALQLVALEYVNNEAARSMIDRVLECASK